MKINSEIVTSYDLEKEINYLIALNPQLKNIDKDDLNKIAKRSIVKEVIRKNEILRYKKLDLQNSQITNVLNKEQEKYKRFTALQSAPVTVTPKRQSYFLTLLAPSLSATNAGGVK